MQLSEHFSREEFELDGPMPDECVPAFQAFCRTLLEPIRAEFNSPIIITSGYRSPTANAQAHGVQYSEHVATPAYCAADFKLKSSPDRGMREVFNWVRLADDLSWGQVILEHGEAGDIVHLSWEAAKPRRQAFEGHTANQTGYIAWDVTPLQISAA